MIATVDPGIEGSRRLVLRMDAAAQELLKEALGIGGSVLGGAVGLDLVRRWFTRRRQKQQEPVEITAKIIDDGDALRSILLEREARMQTDRDAAIERAHKAELELAVLKSESSKLQGRLDRKDEQCKALQNQLIGLGATPVHINAPAGRQGV